MALPKETFAAGGNFWAVFKHLFNLGFLFNKELEVGFLTTAPQLWITVASPAPCGYWVIAGDLNTSRKGWRAGHREIRPGLVCCLGCYWVPYWSGHNFWALGLSLLCPGGDFAKSRTLRQPGCSSQHSPAACRLPLLLHKGVYIKVTPGLLPSPGWHCARLKFKSAWVWQVRME